MPVRVGVTHLQRGDDAARLVAQPARFVERRLVAGAHETAVAAKRRQLLGERSTEFCGERAVWSAKRLDRPRQVAGQLGQCRNPCGDCRRGEDAIADGGKIARAAAADHDAGESARQIGRRLQPLAQVGARGAVVDESGDRVEAMRDLERVGQRRGKPLRQQPRARRRHGPVDGGKERAAPLAAERADQFEIAARRLIDRQRRPRRLAYRRR